MANLSQGSKALLEQILKEHKSSYPMPTMEDASYVMLMLAFSVAKRNIYELVSYNSFPEKEEQEMIKLGVSVMKGSTTPEAYYNKFIALIKKVAGKITIDTPQFLKDQIITRINSSKHQVVNVNLKESFRTGDRVKGKSTSGKEVSGEVIDETGEFYIIATKSGTSVKCSKKTVIKEEKVASIGHFYQDIKSAKSEQDLYKLKGIYGQTWFDKLPGNQQTKVANTFNKKISEVFGGKLEESTSRLGYASASQGKCAKCGKPLPENPMSSYCSSCEAQEREEENAFFQEADEKETPTVEPTELEIPLDQKDKDTLEKNKEGRRYLNNVYILFKKYPEVLDLVKDPTKSRLLTLVEKQIKIEDMTVQALLDIYTAQKSINNQASLKTIPKESSKVASKFLNELIDAQNKEMELELSDLDRENPGEFDKETYDNMMTDEGAVLKEPITEEATPEDKAVFGGILFRMSPQKVIEFLKDDNILFTIDPYTLYVDPKQQENVGLVEKLLQRTNMKYRVERDSSNKPIGFILTMESLKRFLSNWSLMNKDKEKEKRAALAQQHTGRGSIDDAPGLHLDSVNKEEESDNTVVDANAKAKIDELLSKYKGQEVPDPEIHKLASELKINTHAIESYIYSLASQHLTESKAPLKESRIQQQLTFNLVTNWNGYTVEAYLEIEPADPSVGFFTDVVTVSLGKITTPDGQVLEGEYDNIGDSQASSDLFSLEEKEQIKKKVEEDFIDKDLRGTETKQLKESKEVLKEYECYVDDKGMGTDDEGNKFYVSDKSKWGQTCHPRDISSKKEVKNTSYMTTYTTKQLGEKLGLSSYDTTSKLKEKGYIKYNVDTKVWNLTDAGRAEGGQSRAGKFGTFLVWPLSMVNKLKEGEEEKWVDPAGGTHYGNEEDPAKMYEAVENAKEYNKDIIPITEDREKKELLKTDDDEVRTLLKEWFAGKEPLIELEQLEQKQIQIYNDAADAGLMATPELSSTIKRCLTELKEIYGGRVGKWGDANSNGVSYTIFVPIEMDGTLYNGEIVEVSLNYDRKLPTVYKREGDKFYSINTSRKSVSKQQAIKDYGSTYFKENVKESTEKKTLVEGPEVTTYYKIAREIQPQVTPEMSDQQIESLLLQSLESKGFNKVQAKNILSVYEEDLIDVVRAKLHQGVMMEEANPGSSFEHTYHMGFRWWKNWKQLAQRKHKLELEFSPEDNCWFVYKPGSPDNDLVEKVRPGHIATYNVKTGEFFTDLSLDDLKAFKTKPTEVLQEDPDTVDIPKQHIKLEHSNSDAIPFGYNPNDGRLYIGKPKTAHYELLMKRPEYNKDFGLEREDWDYAGRLWKGSRVVSFWRFPKKQDLDKFVADWNNEKEFNYGIVIDPSNWYIEVPGKTYSELVAIKDYTGTEFWTWSQANSVMRSNRLSNKDYSKKPVMQESIQKTSEERKGPGQMKVGDVFKVPMSSKPYNEYVVIEEPRHMQRTPKMTVKSVNVSDIPDIVAGNTEEKRIGFGTWQLKNFDYYPVIGKETDENTLKILQDFAKGILQHKYEKERERWDVFTAEKKMEYDCEKYKYYLTLQNGDKVYAGDDILVQFSNGDFRYILGNEAGMLVTPEGKVLMRRRHGDKSRSMNYKYILKKQ